MNSQSLWSQEFAQESSLDTQYWNYDLGDGSNHGIPGWGNLERESYTAENAAITGGNLQILAQRSTEDDPAVPIYYGPRAEWLSSKITTKNKVAFKYGRISIVAKMPKGDGTWPAIWMLGTDIDTNQWPNCGEIDIFELRGDRPKNAFFTLHGPGYFGENGSGGELKTSVDFTEDFHEFTIEWLPGSIEWKLDGISQQIRTAEDVSPNAWVFDKEFYLILNLAMGGNFTGPLDENLTSAELLVKSITFSQINGVGSVNLTDPTPSTN